MNALWLLIILTYSDQVASVTTFSSEGQCNAAKAVVQQTYTEAMPHSAALLVSCKEVFRGRQ